jgi:hypothetical protein
MPVLMAIVFGWPSALLGLALLLGGALAQRASLSIGGAVVSTGFCAYLAMNPFPFALLGLAGFAGGCLSARASWRGAAVVALGWCLPLLVVVVALRAFGG